MGDDVSVSAAKWDEAFTSGDTASLAAFYSTDALLLPAGGEAVSGPDAIGKFFADLKSKGFRDHKISVKDILDRGDTVIAAGKWQLSGPGDDGVVKQYGGNWINVLGKEGSDWRILLHTWN